MKTPPPDLAPPAVIVLSVTIPAGMRAAFMARARELNLQEKLPAVVISLIGDGLATHVRGVDK